MPSVTFELLKDEGHRISFWMESLGSSAIALGNLSFVLIDWFERKWSQTNRVTACLFHTKVTQAAKLTLQLSVWHLRDKYYLSDISENAVAQERLCQLTSTDHSNKLRHITLRSVDQTMWLLKELLNVLLHIRFFLSFRIKNLKSLEMEHWGQARWLQCRIEIHPYLRNIRRHDYGYMLNWPDSCRIPQKKPLISQNKKNNT